MARIGGQIDMLVLGIETSCDEISFSIVKDGCEVLSCVTGSSVDLCAKYGGIVPEIVSRKHLEFSYPLLVEVFAKVGLDPDSIDVVAVTNRPGLLPSLLVGVSIARAFSLGLEKPLVSVDHVLAHIYSVFLDNSVVPEFPFIGLVVSGGHTELFLISGWSLSEIKLIGKTRDDAAGETLDKAARLLGLGYPGGPIVEKMAKEGQPIYKFSCYKGNGFDFSFSGLKTSLLYFLKKEKDSELSLDKVRDICCSFQDVIMEVIVDKTVKAGLEYSVKDIVIGGGVSANNYLRQLFKMRAASQFKVHFPEKRFCGDNGAMIAGLGTQWFMLGLRDDIGLPVSSISYWEE